MADRKRFTVVPRVRANRWEPHDESGTLQFKPDLRAITIWLLVSVVACAGRFTIASTAKSQKLQLPAKEKPGRLLR